MDKAKTSSFGRLVLGKAISNTKRSFESIRRDIILAILSLVFGFAFFLSIEGMPKAMNEVITAGAFTLAPLGLVVLAVFLWNLFLAPAELAYEAVKTSAAPAPASPPPPSINWAIWKQRSLLSVEEFSSLLANRIASDQESYWELLLEEMKIGRLPYIKTYSVNYEGRKYENSINGNTQTKKADAIAWAESKGFDVEGLK